jgi:hypothetical protein
VTFEAQPAAEGPIPSHEFRMTPEEKMMAGVRPRTGSFSGERTFPMQPRASQVSRFCVEGRQRHARANVAATSISTSGRSTPESRRATSGPGGEYQRSIFGTAAIQLPPRSRSLDSHVARSEHTHSSSRYLALLLDPWVRFARVGVGSGRRG